MAAKKSSFNKVLNAWDVLVIAFGAMIGWAWVVSTGDWITGGGVFAPCWGSLSAASASSSSLLRF